MKKLIKKILRESEDEFEWVIDSLNSGSLDWVPKGGDSDYQLFYFFPYITKKEYMQYVMPILQLNKINLPNNIDFRVDHLEIHPTDYNNRINRITAMAGDVNYFGVSGTMEHVKNQYILGLSEDGALAHDGREVFNIPLDPNHPQLKPQSKRFVR